MNLGQLHRDLRTLSLTIIENTVNLRPRALAIKKMTKMIEMDFMGSTKER
jgi:hypothetical protein